MNGENWGFSIFFSFPQTPAFGFSFFIFTFYLNIEMYLAPISKMEKSVFLCETLYHKMNSKIIKNSTLNAVM